MNDESQIRMLIENWAAAVRSQDMDAILAHHSADVVMYDVTPPFESVGIEAYRKTWVFFKCIKPDVFDIIALNIIAGEEVAFCYAKMKCADSSGSGDFVELPFRLTIGLKKIDGQWIIMHEHHLIPAE
jgi:ketosteroid isomerase-like protein